MPGAPEVNLELRLIASGRERVCIHFFFELELLYWPVAVEVGPGGDIPQNHILGITHWNQLGLLVHTVLSPFPFLLRLITCLSVGLARRFDVQKRSRTRSFCW